MADLIKNIIEKWSRKTEKDMKDILIQSGKGNSRIIKQIKINFKETTKGWVMSTSLPSYAKFVDSGRKPGKQPPLKVILDWTKRKGIDKKWAYPIARLIGKKGLKPTNFLNPLRIGGKELGKLIPELRTAYLNYVREEVTKVFKK